MALKPDRTIIDEQIAYFMFSTGEAGGVVFSASGTGGWPTGPALDSPDRRVEYTASPSGRQPIGILTQDVVNVDLSRQIVNPLRPETQIGGKVNVAVRGRVVTNQIAAGQASGLAVPAPAYAGINGQLYSDAGYAASGWVQVGNFLTNKDSEGYAEVQIDRL
jgi:hypothetical protein